MRRPYVAIFLTAVPVSALLFMFANACGAIHGAPACGAASYAAVPLVVMALLLERGFYGAPQSDTTVLILLWLVAYLVSLLTILLGYWVWHALRGRVDPQ